jgi:hypothetical protein
MEKMKHSIQEANIAMDFCEKERKKERKTKEINKEIDIYFFQKNN